MNQSPREISIAMPRAETNKRVIVYPRLMSESIGSKNLYEMVADVIHKEDFSCLEQELKDAGYHVHGICGRVSVNSSIEMGCIGKCPRYPDTHGWASVVRHVPPGYSEDLSNVREIMEKYDNRCATSCL